MGISAPFTNGFAFAVDNFGTTLNDGMGTLIPFSASANTKNSTDTQMLTGIAQDCYFISVGFMNGSGSASSDNFLFDIKIDPNAGVGGTGTTFTTIIPNLLSRGPQMSLMNGCWYSFPLFIPAGSAIAANGQQSAAGGGNIQCAVRLYGKPTRPELTRTGSQVQALGVVTTTSLGTTFTPGTNAKGSYSASLGTLSAPSWWWQFGMSVNDTTQTAMSYLIDVAFDATTKYIAINDQPYNSDATENNGFQSCMSGGPMPICEAPAGVDVFIRAAASTTPDSAITGAVYVVQD